MDLLNVRALCVDVLKLFRGDVLSLSQLENVLCSVNDSDTSIGQDNADVTRQQPPVFNGLLVLFIVFEVALEDRGTFETDFSSGVGSVLRCVSHFWNVPQADLAARNGSTYVASH